MSDMASKIWSWNEYNNCTISMKLLSAEYHYMRKNKQERIEISVLNYTASSHKFFITPQWILSEIILHSPDTLFIRISYKQSHNCWNT